jgi:ferric-dicitrate binding protein FerR (iron transport regulator)
VAIVDPAGNSALTALYSDHHGWLHGWLRRKLGCAGRLARLASDAWEEWLADLRTATGEQKSFGTRLVLNTASAVDVAFSSNERLVKLVAGEILITTGRDPSPDFRPFILQTRQGNVRALGGVHHCIGPGPSQPPPARTL